MTEPVVPCDIIRVEAATRTTARDVVAVEAPLEVRVDGEPFSVIMRTPGHDHDLALGFLFTEGVIARDADVASLVCGSTGDTVEVRLSATRAAAVPGLLQNRRQVTMNSSCGLCGRRSLESLTPDARPVTAAWSLTPDVVCGLPAALRSVQAAFDETGGLHAAGLFDRWGRLDQSAEDVGRHNAVDKLVGRMLRAGRLPLDESVLMVSGRLSFEIVQKAWLAGVPMVAAVSAPSSLAVSLAQEAGMTLVAFLRGGRFNIYSGADRVQG